MKNVLQKETQSLTFFFLCVINCSARGHGAKGQNEYEFSLEFLFPVKPEVCVLLKCLNFNDSFPLSLFCIFIACIYTQVSYKSTQRQVNVVVGKEKRGWWERLVTQERKPVFLAPDFDRWLEESDAEMEIREKVGWHAFILKNSDKRNYFLLALFLFFFSFKRKKEGTGWGLQGSKNQVTASLVSWQLILMLLY